MIEDLRDFRQACRRLLQSPGFTLAVLLILGLGLGVTTAVVSVLDAALLRPLPYPAPERLVTLYDVQGEDRVPASYPELLDWQRGAAPFAEIGASFHATLTLTGAGEPETLPVARMSAGLPRLLGVVPRLGRTFLPGEEAPGAPRVALLSDSLWRRRFGADRRIVGRALTLGGEPYTVVGVLPSPAEDERATVPADLPSGRRADLWVPLQLNPADVPRGLHFLDVWGRLRPGVSQAQAEERTAELARRLRESKVTDHGIHLSRLDLRVVGDARPLLFALAGAAVLVLLIACTNVASLLLARSAGRRREIAIQAAIGAARGRIVRQLLAESLLLGLLGGAAGALVAKAGVAGFRALGPESVPRLAAATVDLRLLLFALALSLATGLLFGLAPALQASRPDLAEVMKAGAPGAAGGPARDRFRASLVVAEVALSFALLLGAGLLMRSLGRLLAVDKGWNERGVVSAALDLPASRYPEKRQQAAFFRDLRQRLATLPGVRGAALANNLPLVGGVNGGIGIEGRTFPKDAPAMAEKRIVSPGYFAVLGVPVVAGRAIDERDTAGAPPVVVVNQAFARRYFPGENPLGRRVDFSWETTGMQQVVGVVGDVRERGLTEPAGPEIYIPLAQRPDRGMFLLVRAAGSPAGLVPALRQAVYALDREEPLAEVETLAEVVDADLASRRFALSLFGVFSVLALVLAAVGLYAVISYSVEQRRKELGIRLALGAKVGLLAGEVLRRGLALIALGVALGALAALGLGRFLASLVFGVGTADPATFAGVALLLVATALLASLVPALRAAKVDPAGVLRSE